VSTIVARAAQVVGLHTTSGRGRDREIAIARERFCCASASLSRVCVQCQENLHARTLSAAFLIADETPPASP